MRSIAFILAPAMILAGGAAAGAAETVVPPPIRLAVFPFELEDFSAGAAFIPPDEIDREQLRLSTEEARRLIADPGATSWSTSCGTNNRESRPAAHCGRSRRASALPPTSP